MGRSTGSRPVSIREELEEERRRNLEDIIRFAKLEAEMVKKMGRKWFRMRDEWLRRAYEADAEFLRKNPEVAEALRRVLLSSRKQVSPRSGEPSGR